MKFPWRTYAALGVGVAVITMAGCAPAGGGDAGASPGGDVKIEFQTGLGTDDPTLKVLTTITKACAPDGVDVALVPMTNTYEADMKVRLASGDVPDIWSTHGWSLLRYSEFLEPLDTQPWAKNFNPALDAAMMNDAGQFFALPINTDVAGIVYNKTVLEDAGIDVKTLTTWEAFGDAAATLKAAGITPISASSKDSWFAGNVADFGASGAYTPEELETLRAGTFATDGYAALLGEIETWAKAGYFNADFTSATMDDLARALGSGDTGFIFVQNYLVASALGFNPDAQLGYFPIPGFVTDPYLIGGEGTAYGVSKTSKNKDAALAYIDCLAEPSHIGTLAGAIGGIPGLTNATSDLGALQDSYDEFVADGNFRLEPYFDRVYLPNGMWDTMVTTTAAVITGQSDVPAATSQMEQQFNALFGQE